VLNRLLVQDDLVVDLRSRKVRCPSHHFKSGTDLLAMLILFFLVGRSLPKSLRLRPFKSDHDEIWQHCSSSKYEIN